jgi:hypothetical protein
MNNYQWIWQGKAIPLEKLHTTQLNSIRKTLVKNKGTTWFNIDSVDWRKAIKTELARRVALEETKKHLNKLKSYKTCVHRIIQMQQK